MADARTWTRWRWVGAWTGAFLLNLPVPLLFGVSVTRADGGAAGMWGAVAALWAGGLVVRAASDRAAYVLIKGGLRTALTQLLVGPHMAAGFAAMRVWELAAAGLGLVPFGEWADLNAFVITVLVAQPFLWAAWLFGGGVRLMLGRPEWPTANQADYDDVPPPTPSP